MASLSHANATSIWLDSDLQDPLDRVARLAAAALHASVTALSLGPGEPLRCRLATPGRVRSFAAVAKDSPFVDEVWLHGAASVTAAPAHLVYAQDAVLAELGLVRCTGLALRSADGTIFGALLLGGPEAGALGRSEHEVAVALVTTLQVELLFVGRLRRAEDERLLLQTAIDALEDGVLVHDPRLKLLFANRAMARLLGPGFGTRTPGEWAAQYGLFQPDGITPVQFEEMPMVRAGRGETVRDLEFVSRTSARLEDDRTFVAQAAPLPLLDGTILGTVSAFRETTEKKRLEVASAQNEALFRAVVEQLPHSAIIVYDENLVYRFAGGVEILAGLGLTPAALVGKSLFEVASPENVAALEAAYRSALLGHESRLDVVGAQNGREYAVTVSPVRLGGVQQSGVGLITFRDVTEQQTKTRALLAQAEALRNSATRDELTKLYNRRGLLEIGTHLLKSAMRRRARVALLFIDVDGLKPINDELGHDEGDRALREVADVLRAGCRDADLVARLGGDEFVVLAPESDAQGAEVIVQRIRALEAAASAKPGRLYRMGMSIGVAVYDPAEPQGLEELLLAGDAAMYEQKRARRATRA